MSERPLRWFATLTYATDSGPSNVYHYFDELDHLAELVEYGPDWNAIDKIEIVVNPAYRHPMTVEEAAEL